VPTSPSKSLESVIHCTNRHYVSFPALENFDDEFHVRPGQLLEALTLGHLVKVIAHELHCVFSQPFCRVLVTCVENGRRVVSVNVLDDRLFAHELQSVDAKQVRTLEQLHYVVQSDRALVGVEVG